MYFQSKATFKKESVVILFDESQVKEKNFSFGNAVLAEEISKIISQKLFEGKDGQIFPIAFKGILVLLVGLGKKKQLSLTALRIAVRKALLSGYLKNIRDVEIVPHDKKDEAICAIIEGVKIGTYAWTKYIHKDPADASIDEKNIFICVEAKKSYLETAEICEGVNIARDLVNDNADVVNSEYFEKVVQWIIKGKKKVSVEVLNRKEMQQKGLGLHLAVNQGSKNEPKLIIVKYNGNPKKDNYTAFIGKGMTYDTGGLNLKPTGGIETMRIDMSGAAAVAGTMANALNLGIDKNVLFVFALAENAIDKDSYKPGDVFISYSGKSVEILNTDAEGRLVLADAISYVIKNYKPSRIIDIATLTGACVVALGHDYSGLIANDDALADRLIEASTETDDRVWRLPSYPELKNNVKSKIADIANIGHPRGAAGTLTAAEFLRQFAEETKWAHLDIAGSAFVDGADRFYFGHGATGAGVRLVTRYLQK